MIPNAAHVDRPVLVPAHRGKGHRLGVGAASTNDRALADTLFAARANPEVHLPCVGVPISDDYVADMGFSGQLRDAAWAQAYGAVVVCPPQPQSHHAWPKPLQTWLAGLRQIIERGNDRLLTTFGLDHERAHHLSGLCARLAATMGLHNACPCLKRRAGRPDLAFANLIDW